MTRIERVAAVVAAARAAYADADSLATASRQDVVDLLALTAELSRLVDAQQVRLAGAIAERSKGPDDEPICRLLGARSPREAIASAFGIRGRDAGELLTMASATTAAVGLTGQEIPARFPRVASALDDGDLSLAQARAIVTTLEPAVPRADLEQLAWAEDCLVDAATDPEAPLVPELLVVQARTYVAVLDPDGVLPNAERQRAMRSFRMWRRRDGGWGFDGYSPPEEGSALSALLDAYTSPRTRVRFTDDPGEAAAADAEEAAASAGGAGAVAAGGVGAGGVDTGAVASATAGAGSAGTGAAGTGAAATDAAGLALADCLADDHADDRTPDQKRHDVLIALATAHAASGGAPVAGAEAPRLVFTGTVEAFDAYLRDVDHPDRSLTIEHTGAIVPIETAGRLLCDAIVQRAVVDGDGHVLDLGREQRTFSRAQRRALAVQYRGCATPGCGLPVAWTEAHHVIWWQHGGPTDVDNGILLCSHCHHEVHAGRLLVVGTPGHWRVTAQLRPADRYARNRRAGTRAPTAAAAAAAVVTAAHAAPAPLAAKLADRAAVELPDRAAVELLDRAALELPDRAAVELPDRAAVKRPDRAAVEPPLPAATAPTAAAAVDVPDPAAPPPGGDLVPHAGPCTPRGHSARSARGPVEARLRRRVAVRRMPRRRAPAVDRLPSLHVVLRI